MKAGKNDIQGTAVAPQGTAVAPQGTAIAPQGTAVAPQGTAVAPQGTAVAPQGTAAAADNAASAPIKGTSAKRLNSGAQADIIVTKYDGRDCVMKLYKPGYGPNDEVNSALRKLYGKGFVTDILDSGTKDGRSYEIMPYYPNGSLADYDFRGNDMAIINIVIKTAMGLDAMHRAHVIHKDIKPANLLVTDTDSWDTVICDFGIADIISGGKVVTRQTRTPIYAAPELYDPKKVVARLDGEDLFEISPAADYYSLGMTILCLWYGEKAFLKKEHQMAVAKLKDGIKVPDDMPEGLAEMAKGLLEKDPRKRWGYREIRDLLVPEKLGDYGVRLFLNQLCDVRLNNNVGSPDYIAKGDQLGKFLCDVYLWHFTGSKAPAEEKLCELVLDSFREYEDSYMQTYFYSKGDFFKSYSDWMEKCLDNGYNTSKIAPKDPEIRFQISMMKTIKGLGYNPEYRFSDTGEVITNIEELKNVRGDKKKALKDGGLRGWLAVQYQEDPWADFSANLAYENALSEYLIALEEIDSNCKEAQRFRKAADQQYIAAKQAKKAIRGLRFRRLIQCLLSVISMAVSYKLANIFLELAKVNPEGGTGILDHIWIFAVLGIIVGLLLFIEKGSLLLGLLGFGVVSFISLVIVRLLTSYLMWIMFGFSIAIGVFALVILIISLWPRSYAMSPKEVQTGTDDTTLECLDYAFGTDRIFDTSLNGFRTDGRMYWWEDHIRNIRICLIVCLSCLAIAVAGSIFLPNNGSNEDVIPDETVEEVQ